MPKQILTHRPLPVLMAALALGALILAGCAAHKTNKANEVVLEDLQKRLPGRYDNAAQAHSDVRAEVREPHESLDLLIAPANAALVRKKIAYYVREDRRPMITAAGPVTAYFSGCSDTPRTCTPRPSSWSSTSICSRIRSAGCTSARIRSCCSR